MKRNSPIESLKIDPDNAAMETGNSEEIKRIKIKNKPKNSTHGAQKSRRSKEFKIPSRMKMSFFAL